MELYFTISIVDRARSEAMLSLLHANKVQLALTLLGKGTAQKEHLLLYGLEATEKAVICAVAGGEQTQQIIKNAKRKLFIDIPGNGIMMAIPVKSVGGGRTLAYLTDNAAPGPGVPELKFDYELIVTILNEGHTDPVMDAARAAGAGGGTVLHAKGTGAKRANKFFGVSLADEKEMIFIVSKTGEKAANKKAIADRTCPGTTAGAICFSLPISAVAGLRVLED